MRKRQTKLTQDWPSWRYGPFGEAEIFKTEADVPSGWTKKPGDVYTAPTTIRHNRESLLKELADQGIDLNPTWGTAHIKKILE